MSNLNCIICGKSLSGKQTKFCSRQCKAKAHSPNSYTSQKGLRLKRKRALVAHFGGCCQRCGYDKNLAALSFHHLNPNDKAHPLDSTQLVLYSWDEIMREAEKCTLLCLRCHAEEHSPHLFLADIDIEAHIEASRKRARGELDSMFQPVVIANCLQCGLALESGKAKFCSTACSARYRRRHILPSSIKDKYTHCVTCQQPLTGRQRKYCSDACRGKYDWARITSVRPTTPPNEKYCVVCGGALEAGQQKYCSRTCQNKHFQAYDAQQARGLKRKLDFILAHGGQCMTCGYHANLAALAFHHVDAALKSFELDVRALANRSSAALEREVAKCVVLCHNCHAEYHHPAMTPL